MSHGGHRLSDKVRVLSPANSSGVRELTTSVEIHCLCLDQGPMIRTAGAVLKALAVCMPGDAQGATGAIPGYHRGQGSCSCDGISDGSGAHILRERGVAQEPGGAFRVLHLSPSAVGGSCSSGVHLAGGSGGSGSWISRDWSSGSWDDCAGGVAEGEKQEDVGYLW
jgi:hypothetical protein